MIDNYNYCKDIKLVNMKVEVEENYMIDHVTKPDGVKNPEWIEHGEWRC